MSVIGRRALIHNPALKVFEFLIGDWNVTGSHPYLPDVVLHGRTRFECHEGGAFIIMRAEIDHPKFPDGIEIYGSDDQANEFFMLHFDERGVSRKYDVYLTKTGFRWQRDDPTFSQRFTLTTAGNNEMKSVGEMSRNGATWEKDLELIYKRAK